MKSKFGFESTSLHRIGVALLIFGSVIILPLQATPVPRSGKLDLVLPTVGIPKVSEPNVDGMVDVTVEVATVTEEVSNDQTKKKVTSGVYDLRLFRNGQLIGTSTPKESIEKYIKEAPAAAEKDRISRVLLNTEEDKLWREANDLAKVVKFDPSGKASYTFRNIRLPQDGSTDVEFSAYAFNSDRVKSDTVRATYKIENPQTREGNTYLITIGVNKSETDAYDLKYAANDARKMQEILGERIEAAIKGTKSKLIRIPLISEIKDGKAELTATKPIIKAVFDLLAGSRTNVSPEILKQIPNADHIEPVMPEDTVIITFSGHGYADRNGIFYLLPYDIGKDVRNLTTQTLQRLISSDELSLWMRDVTTKEMVMIVDACHSAAAVQGDGFKPGPMGSRGLGQLAYDKRMKILSATQANTVALELGSLEQGLLSYALLQDGIKLGKADADEPKDKKLTTVEWLNYGVKAVPQLYQDVIDGKREIVVNGKSVKFGELDAKDRAAIFCGGKDKECGKKTVQQPSLFDFRRNASSATFIGLR